MSFTDISSDAEEMITNTWPALHSSAAQPFIESTDMLPCKMQALCPTFIQSDAGVCF